MKTIKANNTNELKVAENIKDKLGKMEVYYIMMKFVEFDERITPRTCRVEKGFDGTFCTVCIS